MASSAIPAEPERVNLETYVRYRLAYLNLEVSLLLIPFEILVLRNQQQLPPLPAPSKFVSGGDF